MSKADNKQFAKKIQQIFNELGHDIPLTHAHELLARLSGYRNQHVATKSPDYDTRVQQVMTDAVDREALGTDPLESQKCFKVFLEKQALAEKAYYIQATNHEEVRHIMNQYIDYQNGELSEWHGDKRGVLKKGVKLHPEVEKLIRLEDESDFTYSNWSLSNLAIFGEGPSVSNVYNA